MPQINAYDITKIRNDFPVLNQKVHDKPLIYLDNAATTQKPQSVINAITQYYETINANIHRGLHTLADKATWQFENSRSALAKFINAQAPEQVIFTRGVTEAINLVARSYGAKFLKAGDEVLISTLEHHSNIVPWQLICDEKGAILKIIPISDDGEIIYEEYIKLLSEKVKIVSIVHVSNALGIVNPVNQMIQDAHKYGAVVLVDGAQAASHLPIDVQTLDADFYALSAHKFYGPTGIGALYGKHDILDSMNPYMGGGEMIKEVTFAGTTYNELPYKFEAGTPNIADTIAMSHALDYITKIGKGNIASHEDALLHYATGKLLEIPNLQIFGNVNDKVSVISFLVKGIHPQDMGIILDSEGVAVRTGHHCTQPLMARLGISGTVRASFAMYNTFEEIDTLVFGIHKAVKMLQ
ncbi:MAG: cysteine desulfurase [Cytophagales bacterium]|nr:cysteine desulfurase [Cytophagales bacterium]